MTNQHCEHGYKGRCCCNCVNQATLYKHPWNNIPEAKGRISEVFGYACMSVIHEKTQNGIFFTSQHGCCECHDFTKEETDDKSKI